MLPNVMTDPKPLHDACYYYVRMVNYYCKQEMLLLKEKTAQILKKMRDPDKMLVKSLTIIYKG